MCVVSLVWSAIYFHAYILRVVIRYLLTQFYVLINLIIYLFIITPLILPTYSIYFELYIVIVNNNCIYAIEFSRSAHVWVADVPSGTLHSACVCMGVNEWVSECVNGDVWVYLFSLCRRLADWRGDGRGFLRLPLVVRVPAAASLAAALYKCEPLVLFLGGRSFGMGEEGWMGKCERECSCVCVSGGMACYVGIDWGRSVCRNACLRMELKLNDDRTRRSKASSAVPSCSGVCGMEEGF